MFLFLNRGIVTDPLMIQDLFVWRFTRCQIEYTLAGNEPQDTQQLQDRVIRNSKAHHASYSILCVSKVFYPMASFTVGNKHLWPMFSSSSFMPENAFGEVVRGTLYGRYFFKFWSEQWFSKHGISWPRLTPVQRSRKHLVMWRRP